MVLCLLGVVAMLSAADAFAPHSSLPITVAQPSLQRPSFVVPKMCICINCSRVTNCKAYHFVEEQHAQPHMNDNPDFLPREGQPKINVSYESKMENMGDSVRPFRNKEEEERVKAEHKAKGLEEPKGVTMKRMKPTFEMEYDVVECADFVEDIGCWVRNMPEEIRLANPDFVPT
eukprot:CAMPEP_0194028186 /NCGR_PEP_ID=MMETSP0009_2-20130614/2219_1 /TAXON_ID=210454 /ORGANISM="Grammatophora oceanica, Strain CCMP 410" /LENGTH=173 /DNA_ID=CAMNT_0038667499 /DNA_START=101 /DNA_END=622 /DNA_ORIENTATION=+